MAHLIEVQEFGWGWITLLQDLLENGVVSSPREKMTKELLNVTLVVEHGLSNVMVHKLRDINYRFMIAEWLWIAAGLEDVATIAQYNSIMKNFSDDGQILSGAYGPRIKVQMNYILEKLKLPDSRQAVATIWTSSPAESKDIPCTISLQWFVRNRFLHCTVNMRSSDLWLGLPYDYFTFSQLTNQIGSTLGIPIGTITMNLASSHLYEENWEKGSKCCYEPVETLDSPQLPLGKQGPSSIFIQGLLNRDADISRYTHPWQAYGQALRKDKAHALEVLRAISPIK